MKKTISFLLCLCLLASGFSVSGLPVKQTGVLETVTGTATPRPLGRYHCFTFGQDGDLYDYNAVYNQPVTYKGNSFYPYYCFSDKTVTTSAEYGLLPNGTGAVNTDVLRLTSTGSVYFTPLSADGAPFEVVPGKDYVFRMKAYLETDTDWSQLYVCLGTSNTRVSSNSENYYNNSKPVTGYGSNGAAKPEDVTVLSVEKSLSGYANRPISVNGFTVNNGNNWASKHYGSTTETARRIEKTVYFKVPSNADYGVSDYAVYDTERDAYSLRYPLYSDAALTKMIDADHDGVQDVQINNNYLTFFISGGTFDDGGVTRPFTYDIESVEIWENGYTPDVEMIVGEQTVTTVDGSLRSHIPYFVPDTPDGTYFSGWYTDAARTKLADAAGELPPSVTKLYAGFTTYQTEMVTDPAYSNSAGTVGLASFVANDLQGEYLSHVDRGGWSFRSVSNGTICFGSSAYWDQAGSYIADDNNGNAYVAQPFSTYEITVEYKVDNLVSAAEVGTLPNGSTYSDGFVQLGVGIGMNQARRRDLQNAAFTTMSNIDKLTAETDWCSKTYTVTTGDLAGQLPVFGVYATSYRVPQRFSSGGDPIASEPGDLTYGMNTLLIRKITIKRYANVSVYDDTGAFITTVNAPKGGCIDCSTLLNGNDVRFADGTGYTLKNHTYYSDQACTNPIKDQLFTLENDENAVYLKGDAAVQKTDTQQAFYGFEDVTDSVYHGFSLVKGYYGEKAIQTTAPRAEFPVFPDWRYRGLRPCALGFYYKSEHDATLLVQGNAYVLPAADDWQFANVPAKMGYSSVTVGVKDVNGRLTLDSFCLTDAVLSGGVSVLTDEAAAGGQQAMRFYGRYAVDENGWLILGTGAEKIAERGVLVMDAARLNGELLVGNKSAYTVVKTKDLDTCWDYSDGVVTYSAYLDHCRLGDARQVVSRAYVITADGNVYYSQQAICSVASVKDGAVVQNEQNQYSLADPAVLQTVRPEGAYDLCKNGVTMDWTGCSVDLDAYCMGEVTLYLHIPGSVYNQTFAVYLDGTRVADYVEPIPVNLTDATYKVVVETGAFPKAHTITFARRSEAYYGYMEATDIALTGHLTQTQRYDRLVEFIGDSITCGMGNIDNMGNARSTDGTQAYAYLTARALQVDFRIRSRSGIGFQYANGGNTGKQYSWDASYPYANVFRDSATPYTPQKGADIVCIYLGTNDASGWKYATGKTIEQDFDAVVKEMKELVTIVKAYNPDAQIVWITGGMTSSYRSQCTAAMRELGGEKAGYYVCALPDGMTSGAAGHPDLAQHRSMSDQLIDFLNDML